MVELDELATRAVADPVSRPQPMTTLEDRVHQRRRQRRRRIAGSLAITLVLAVVAVGAGARMLGSDASTDDVVTAGPSQDGGSVPDRWGGLDVAVFLQRDIPEGQLDELEQLVDGHPDVSNWSFMDKEESVEEYRQVFDDSDEMLRWVDENPDSVPQSFRIVTADVDNQSRRALVNLLEQAPGVFSVSWDPDWLATSDPDDASVALGGLFDQPATPEDEFPENFAEQWDWEPHPPDLELDFDTSRRIAFADDTPFYAVLTESRERVCFVLAIDPPDWYPDVASVHPVACTDADNFNRSGLTLRVCGPDDRWITAALVPIGLDPEVVEPYGTLHPSGAAILYAGTGPVEPVELVYAPGETVTLEGAPVGTQPEDGSVPC